MVSTQHDFSTFAFRMGDSCVKFDRSQKVALLSASRKHLIMIRFQPWSRSAQTLISAVIGAADMPGEEVCRAAGLLNPRSTSLTLRSEASDLESGREWSRFSWAFK
jgi:hypothetical protein